MILQMNYESFALAQFLIWKKKFVKLQSKWKNKIFIYDDYDKSLRCIFLCFRFTQKAVELFCATSTESYVRAVVRQKQIDVKATAHQNTDASNTRSHTHSRTLYFTSTNRIENRMKLVASERIASSKTNSFRGADGQSNFMISVRCCFVRPVNYLTNRNSNARMINDASMSLWPEMICYFCHWLIAHRVRVWRLGKNAYF